VGSMYTTGVTGWLNCSASVTTVWQRVCAAWMLKMKSLAKSAISYRKSIENLSLIIAGTSCGQSFKQRRQVVRVLFLGGEDFFEHAARGRVLLAEIADHFAIALDGDALGDQILFDHVAQRAAFDIFGVAARRQAVGRKIRLAAQLDDALRNAVGVRHFLVRMLEKFGRGRRRVHAGGHEV